MDATRNGHGPDTHDPVEANRAAHPRRTPGRPELGADVTRRVTLAALGVVIAATAVLVVVVSTS